MICHSYTNYGLSPGSRLLTVFPNLALFHPSVLYLDTLRIPLVSGLKKLYGKIQDPYLILNSSYYSWNCRPVQDYCPLRQLQSRPDIHHISRMHQIVSIVDSYISEPTEDIIER